MSPEPLSSSGPKKHAFQKEEERSVAGSGNAGLSSEEKFVLFEDIFWFMQDRPYDAKQIPEGSPLFFGAWPGMRLFHHLKPFSFLRRQKPSPPTSHADSRPRRGG